MRRLAPFFSYYGSKHRSIGRYPRPSFGKIIEPFAGSAAYVTRYFWLNVTLYEVDPGIAGLWRYLIRVGSDEVRSIPLLGPEEVLDDLRCSEEGKLLVSRWLNKGTTHRCETPTSWMRSGKYARQFWGEEIRERVARQVEHIRHWKVVEASYETALDEKATWFVDPPYEGRKGRYYRNRVKDFGSLAEWCMGRRGQVIVCEAGGSWMLFRATGKVRSTKGYSPEAIWTRDDAALFA